MRERAATIWTLVAVFAVPCHAAEAPAEGTHYAQRTEYRAPKAAAAPVVDGVASEAAWGAAFLKKCLDSKTLELVNAISSGYGYWGRPEDETDNKPQTGDERLIRAGQGNAAACTAGFALLGKHMPEYLTLAKRLYEKHGGDMPTILALYRATGESSYRNAAQKLSLIHISEPTRQESRSRMPSSG